MAAAHSEETRRSAKVVVPLTFPLTRVGYRHELLARPGRVCLVERTSTHPDSQGSVHYEVIVLRRLSVRLGPRGAPPAGVRGVSVLDDLGPGGLDVHDSGRCGVRYDALCLETPSTRGATRPGRLG